VAHWQVVSAAFSGGIVGFSLGLIGGRFLIVPGLINATAMPLINAIGSSLVSVAVFGAATAASYAHSGLVGAIAGFCVAGGAASGVTGSWAAKRLAARKTMLTRLFAVVVAAVGICVVARGIGIPI